MVSSVIKEETSKKTSRKRTSYIRFFRPMLFLYKKKTNVYFISTVKDNGIVSCYVSEEDRKFVKKRIK